MYCRRGGNLNEVGQSGLDMRQWICDLRSTMPTREDAYRRQGSFVRADHNEIPGVLEAGSQSVVGGSGLTVVHRCLTHIRSCAYLLDCLECTFINARGHCMF